MSYRASWLVMVGSVIRVGEQECLAQDDGEEKGPRLIVSGRKESRPLCFPLPPAALEEYQEALRIYRDVKKAARKGD